MNDITIFYQGGSGGFALYYYLLLSGQYQYNVDTVNQMIKKQFPKQLSTAPHTWKEKEFWPDNVTLKNQTGSKLFLICNPLFNPDMHKTNQLVSNGTYKILLYTDIHLQLRMAYEKKAYWFTEISRQYFQAPNNDKRYMRQIISSGKNYNNNLVDPGVLDIIKVFLPNQIVKLEDFIQSTAIDNFPRPTQLQLDFLKHWKSLQPAKAKIY